jgi:heme-degrading monooxygenase HmoA
MFGTIARVRVKPGHEAELERLSAEVADANPPGWVRSYVMRSKDDPQERWIVAIFESEQAYYDNASRPETAAQYEGWSAAVEGAPEWRDVHVESEAEAKAKA